MGRGRCGNVELRTGQGTRGPGEAGMTGRTGTIMNRSVFEPQFVLCLHFMMRTIGLIDI